MTLERIVEFDPAYDERPKYGIHGVTLRFVLKGPEGAVQFVVFTNWMLPHVTEETDERTLSIAAQRGPLDRTHLKVFYHPMPADLGYHSPKPMYEDHRPMGAVNYNFDQQQQLNVGKEKVWLPLAEETGTFDPCKYLDGKPCYYDGSGLNAEPVFEVLLREGSEGVWRELEKYYHETFFEREPYVPAAQEESKT